MTRHPHLDPSAFYLEGGATGILLIHGFTSSPPEMRLVGDYLHQRGLTVSAPLLPGHGTTVEELNRCRWTDWPHHVDQALVELRSRCQRAFVGGLSMGSLLSIYLAVHNDVAGAILYSPAIKARDRAIHLAPVLKYLVPWKPKSGKSGYTDPEATSRRWSYDKFPSYAAHELLKLMRYCRVVLPQVDCPLLIFQSTLDRVIQPDCGQYVYQTASSSDKELVILQNSDHNLTVDSEWEYVARKTYSFIEAHLPQEG